MCLRSITVLSPLPNFHFNPSFAAGTKMLSMQMSRGFLYSQRCDWKDKKLERGCQRRKNDPAIKREMLLTDGKLI